MSKNATRLFPFLKLFFFFSLFFASSAAAQCPQLVWADEFNGSTLDPGKWTPQIGNGCDIGLCGWGNNELQYYTDKSTNLAVSNGSLTITARKERIQSNAYTSARIRSINKGDFTYGRMEARMKLPAGQGLWPAFWMLSTDEAYGGWPQSGELDIMENKGAEPNISYGTLHYGDPYPNNKNTGGRYLLPSGKFSDDFHTFAIEWEPNQIRWYIDGVLFSTKTNSDLAPYRWPFDQRFHFILNLAVGGNFGGDPDASTVFPQSLVVDYVRVYANKLPAITGPDLVLANQTGINFSVAAIAGATYNWSLPAGASVRSGQGTNAVVVDWGSTEGPVKVAISQSCGTQEYAKNIYLKAPVFYGFTFENYDDQRHLTFLSANGTYQPAITNPSPGGVNTTTRVASYQRNSTVQYDVLNHATNQIPDATQYSTRKKKFFLDVYTAAPVGTPILIQLENSSTATASNFPTGRHSRYVALTTKQNQWDRLEFELDAILDAGVPDNGVDRLLILYHSNSYTGDTYYMDNLDSYDVGTTTPTADTQAPTAPTNLSSTGKTDTSISLGWTAATDNVGVSGYEVYKNGTLAGTAAGTSFTATGLTPNTAYTFTVKAKDSAGNLSAASNALSVTTNPGVATALKVEAENYTAMKGVTTQTCTDTGGGLNVSSIDNRDYIDYTVNIPASGTYRVDFRVASSVATGKFDFKKGTTLLASLSVPNTGGNQNWQTISTQVNLVAGTQVFRIAATATGFNLNWLAFEMLPAARWSRPALTANEESLLIYPNPSRGELRIQAPANQDVIEEVQVVSALGKVRTIPAAKSGHPIILTNLPKGVYILKIKQGATVTSRKVVIQ